MAASGFVLNTFPWIWRQSAQECVEAQAACGYTAFEILLTAPHLWPADSARDSRRAFTALLERTGTRIVGLNAGGFDYNLASPARDVREHGISYVREAVDLAADLGADYVLISPGMGRALLPPPRTRLLAWFQASMAVLVPHAERRNVRIAVENIPFTFLPLAAELMDAVSGSPPERVGIIYDLANGFYAGEDPAAGLEQVRSRLVAVHLSDTTRARWVHSAVGQGEVPFERVAQAAISSGFAGPRVLEIVSGEPDVDIPSSASALRAAGW